jgi:SnoaL-like domain
LAEFSGNDRLIAMEEIKQLKARYFRYVDTKRWDLLPSVFSSDCTFSFEGVSPGRGDTYSSVDDFMTGVKQILGNVTSVHHDHTPEITLIDDETASGI